MTALVIVAMVAASVAFGGLAASVCDWAARKFWPTRPRA